MNINRKNWFNNPPENYPEKKQENNVEEKHHGERALATGLKVGKETYCRIRTETSNLSVKIEEKTGIPNHGEQRIRRTLVGDLRERKKRHLTMEYKKDKVRNLFVRSVNVSRRGNENGGEIQQRKKTGFIQGRSMSVTKVTKSLESRHRQEPEIPDEIGQKGAQKNAREKRLD